ncbi:nucleotidyltransferase [Pseudoruegeria sp. HB172150]|uniref:SMODS domain-containing nucleotidyltransferase n=1 Tax=Pseudoruegeria sp. HB172150 TaxID=2721164 RepID=UPI0015563555|nr:nucleotidyltransferase [Pseudoruegeria sp. HB172150]
MKNLRLFKEFLESSVNLNQTRLDSLQQTSDALQRFVDGSDWGPVGLEWYPQGSWAHKTIIKPIQNREYDADILAIVDPVEDWGASDYVNELYRVFRASDRYSDMVRRWSYCVTIEYSGEKRVDVAPCIRRRIIGRNFEVCNRHLDEFESTEPIVFTEWLIGRNTVCGSNSFRKVTRLFKYLRDIKRTFTCSSVCLTTLLANQVFDTDRNSDEVSDTPSTLLMIVTRLDVWLQTRPVLPRVANPAMPVEDFSTCWTDAQYQNFRNQIHRYREWIEDAFNETDRNKSIAKWRRVFGDEFAKDEDATEATAVTAKAYAHLRNRSNSVSETAITIAGDIVDLVKSYGLRAIPPNFAVLPYQKQPFWRTAHEEQVQVRVLAGLYSSKSTPEVKKIVTSEPLNKGRWLLFHATTNTGIPFNIREFEVFWRVTNTGEEALKDNGLRGGFVDANSGNDRWEALKYRGLHFIEAFVVRKRDKHLLGVSEPFYVLIE